MGAIFGFFGVIAVIVLSAMYRGWVLSLFWSWFIVKPFGAPSIGIAVACGISLLAAMLTHQSNVATKNQEFGESVVNAFATTTILWGIGWVISWFI